MVVDSPQSAAARASRIIRCQYPDVEIPEVSITEFVLGRAADRGDKPAIVDGPSGRTLTYAQLFDLVRRAAAGLAANGFKKGDVLGIYSPNVPEYAVAFHAAASLGGISTTVNPLYTTRELAQQLTDCGAIFLLTVPTFEDGAEHPTSITEAKEHAVAAAKRAFDDKLTGLAEFSDRLLSLVMLNVLDEKWKDHLYDLDQLRNAIHYRSWGQKDPLIEYKHEAYTMFVDLMNDVYHTFTERFLRAQISFNAPVEFEGSGDAAGGGPRGPSPVRPQPPRQRYNDLGVLEDIPELEQRNGADGEAEEGGEVVDIGPAEPPTRKKAARSEPVVTGAGRVRSLNPVAQARGVAGATGAAGGIASADWSNVGRNDPCPCGSGKKFKKCHGANQ